MRDSFVTATTTSLGVIREGHAVRREWKIPKPVVLVARSERSPFQLHRLHPNWIGRQKRVTLAAGQYSIEGMEAVLALARKSLADVVEGATKNRRYFIGSCALLEKYRWKAIIIEATYENMKTLYRSSQAHPNAVVGTLDAIEARFGIPIIFTSSRRQLSTEKAASWLSKHFTYWWLEENGHGRVLVDSDEL